MNERNKINVEKALVKGLVEMRDIAVSLIDLSQNLYEKVILLEEINNDERIEPWQLNAAKEYFGLRGQTKRQENKI